MQFDFLPCPTPVHPSANSPIEFSDLTPGEVICDSFVLQNFLTGWPGTHKSLVSTLAKQKTFLSVRGTPCRVFPKKPNGDGSLRPDDMLTSNRIQLDPSGSVAKDNIEKWPFPPNGLIFFARLLPSKVAVVAGQRTEISLTLKNVLPRPISMPSHDVFRTKIWMAGKRPDGGQWSAGAPGGGATISGVEWGIGELGPETFGPLEQRQLVVWYVLPQRGEWELQLKFNTGEQNKPSDDVFRGRLETNVLAVSAE